MDESNSNLIGVSYNAEEFIVFKEKDESIFIRSRDISFVKFYHDKEANNQLKAKIVLSNGKIIIHHFHRNNYIDYLQLNNALYHPVEISEEEWYKTMKVSYK